MDRYVIFINDSDDYLMFPLRAFIGARYASSSSIDLFFEKAPLAYKITITVHPGTGIIAAYKIAELFSRNTNAVITFDDMAREHPFEEIIHIFSFTKVVIK